MKRIIIIDCCAANIIFPDTAQSLPAGTQAIVSGRLIPSAIMLGNAGRQVTVMGEAGRDPLGNLIVNRLEQSGVDIACIDRYSDGSATPCTLVFGHSDGDKPDSIPYFLPLDEQWDSGWPQIDSSDIVMFGGYFALQQRVRHRLLEFLTTARQRGALIVYLPGFNPRLAPNITRVMPALLENLELAHAVIAATPDLQHIFGNTDPRRCFDDRISFYAPLMANVDPDAQLLTLMHGPQTIERDLPACPTADGILPSALQPALFVDALQQLDTGAKTIDALTLPTLEAIANITSSPSISSYIAL